VALEVDALETGQVAQPRLVEPDDLAEEPRILGEAGDAVVG
jgi:hypothetical protein